MSKVVLTITGTDTRAFTTVKKACEAYGIPPSTAWSHMSRWKRKRYSNGKVLIVIKELE